MKLLKSGISILLVILAINAINAQNRNSVDATWYSTTQESIDTLRKGDFAFQIVDENNEPINIPVAVHHDEHEFPWGNSLDIGDANADYGNDYTTTNTVEASVDAEVYQSERWGAHLAYAVSVESGVEYKVTVKLAEIYLEAAGGRLFDCFLEEQTAFADLDKFVFCGGKDIAADTTMVIEVNDGVLNIAFKPTVDNASVMGVMVSTMQDSVICQFNCGGGEITTADGNFYESDVVYFDPEKPRLTSDQDWALANRLKYFNAAASGNSFKWSGIQPEHTAPNYSTFENLLDWTNEQNLPLRAHTLLWGGNDYDDHHSMPQWVKDQTDQQFYDTCEMRVRREVSRYKGIIKEYDVMNEPLHATYTTDRLGDSINWNSFIWAHEEDPDAKLYVNDYNILYSWGAYEEYRDHVNNLLENGAPVDGIGIQGHVWEDFNVNIADFTRALNVVAEVGLPIKITEFDIAGKEQNEQAEETAKMMRMAFAHPAVNGFIFWSFWDAGAWQPLSGMFDEDKNPKVVADTVYNLVHNVWSTDIDDVAPTDDMFSFNGYYGDYTVVVDVEGEKSELAVSFNKDYEDSVMVLHLEDAVLQGPKFLSAEIVSKNEVHFTFDKAIDAASINAKDYKVFTKNPNLISAIELDDVDNSKIKITLLNEVAALEYISINYTQGTTQAVGGGLLKNFGPNKVENWLPGVYKGQTSAEGDYIELFVNHEMQDPSGEASKFEVKINDIDVSVLSVDFKNSDKKILNLALEQNVQVDDTIVVSYNSDSTYFSVKDFPLESFGPVGVENKVPVGIAASKDSKTFELFPNPAKDKLTIAGLNNELVKIEIVNLLGKVVYCNELMASNAYELNIEMLDKGAYILSVVSQNGKSHTKQFVKF